MKKIFQKATIPFHIFLLFSISSSIYSDFSDESTNNLYISNKYKFTINNIKKHINIWSRKKLYKCSLSLPSSSSIPIDPFNYYQVHSRTSISSLIRIQCQKRRFWFLQIDLLSINRDELSRKTSREISNISSLLRDLIFILRSYRRFHVFTRNLRRKHARFRFHQYFHANHTRPMISKLFDRKPPISGTSKLFET